MDHPQFYSVQRTFFNRDPLVCLHDPSVVKPVAGSKSCSCLLPGIGGLARGLGLDTGHWTLETGHMRHLPSIYTLNAQITIYQTPVCALVHYYSPSHPSASSRLDTTVVRIVTIFIHSLIDD